MKPDVGLQLLHSLNGHEAPISNVVWTDDGTTLITAAADHLVRFWDITRGYEVHRLTHLDPRALVLTPDNERLIISQSTRHGIDILDRYHGTPLTTLYGHTAPIHALALTADGSRLISASADGTLRVWGLVNGIQPMTLTNFSGSLYALAITPDSRYVFTGGDGCTLDGWNLDTGKPLDLRMKHNGRITALALTPDGCTLVSASEDLTICFWNVDDGHLFHIIEGHTAPLVGLAFSPDGGVLASYDASGTIRLWRWDSWEQLAVLHTAPQSASGQVVAFHPHAPLLAIPGEKPNELAVLEMDYRTLFSSPSGDQTVRYTTVRVALVGDGGVGKTGLGHRLAYGKFQPSTPTHGQQFWVLDHLNRTDATRHLEREVILWDFAGQPDYRLIHTLFLDQVDIALLLFEAPNRYDPMRGVEYWLHQLASRDANQTTRKILVAAQVDRGYPRLAESELLSFCEFYGIEGGYIGTSAVTGQGVDELLGRIESQIDWERVTTTTTTATFRRIRSFILNLKADPYFTKVLATLADLRAWINVLEPDWEFSDEELSSALRLLENHGYVMNLVGTTAQQVILLKPDLLINLAASLVLEARANPRGLGAIDEDKLLSGGYNFPYLQDLAPHERDTLCQAAAMLLIQHHVCFRQKQDGRSWLIFPALISQKRPYLKDLAVYEDGVYHVTGAVENIYAALVVQLGYWEKAKRLNCWQYQAQFEMGSSEICGFRLEEVKDGEVDLVLYFNAAATEYTRRSFRKRFEQILESDRIVYTLYPPIRCVHCDHIQDREVVVRRIQNQIYHMHCVECGEYVELAVKDKRASGTFKHYSPLEQQLEKNTDEIDELSFLRTAFEMVLVKLKSLAQGREKRPSCFVSYAWGNTEHEEWVGRLVHYLDDAGIEVIWDRWHEPELGYNLARFISQLEHVDYIIAVGTPQYRDKYENKNPKTGSVVAAEVDLIDVRLLGTEPQKSTVLPILLDGESSTSLPPLMRVRVNGDFRQKRFYFLTLFMLICTLYNFPPNDPTIEELRAFLRISARTVSRLP